MPTQQQRFQQLTDGDNFSIGGKARLPERRRRWIRLADAPLPGAPKTTVPHNEYGMFGEVTQTVGTLSADFGYAGYYVHGPSGLNLTTYRAYSPSLGRWINRDPIGEKGGINLYQYCHDNPIRWRDPQGKQQDAVIGGFVGGPLGAIIGGAIDITIAIGVGYGGAVIVNNMQGNSGSGSGAGAGLKKGEIDCNPDPCDPPPYIKTRSDCFLYCRQNCMSKGPQTTLCAVRCSNRFPLPEGSPPPQPKWPNSW